jgi:epsilon-lactone hydrolase
MASTEFHALQEKMAAAPKPDPPANLNELRARIEATMDALPTADGVTVTPVDMDGVPGLMLVPEGGADAPVILYFHGGGFRLASARAYRPYGSQLARACRARVLLVDYRLAPENPFPAAIDDAVTAYRWLRAQGQPAARIVIGGDSAGGGITASALVALRDAGDALPAGGVCISPWVDLTNSNESFKTRAEADKLFGPNQAAEATALYLGDGDPKQPLASPVFADLAGLPPLLVHVGDAEVLLDDAAALAAKARAAGVEVTHRVYPEMPHVWHLSYPAFPEAVEAVSEIAVFVARVAT